MKLLIIKVLAINVLGFIHTCDYSLTLVITYRRC